MWSTLAYGYGVALLPDERTGLFVAYNGSEALPLTFEKKSQWYRRLTFPKLDKKGAQEQ